MILVFKDLIIYFTFLITHIKPAILSSIGQQFFLAKMKSLNKNKIGCTKALDNQYPFGGTLLNTVWKTIMLKSNSLDMSRFI